MHFFLFVVLLLLCTATLMHAADEAEEDFLPSKLLEAAIAGDATGMRAAVAAGESVDTRNSNDWSAAMFCVANGDMLGLETVIELGINLNAVNVDGLSPLMMAASQSDKEMVEVLLAGNASPLIKSADGTTAYSLAIASGRRLVALMIAEASTLHGIAMEDLPAQIEYLQHGAYINIRNGAGYTPLISAASVGDLVSVRKLIDMGADCNRVENDGWSPLHFAAVAGNAELVKILLAANAAPGIVAVDGRTARSIAEVGGFKNIVDLIPNVIELEDET